MKHILVVLIAFILVGCSRHKYAYQESCDVVMTSSDLINQSSSPGMNFSKGKKQEKIP